MTLFNLPYCTSTEQGTSNSRDRLLNNSTKFNDYQMCAHTQIILLAIENCVIICPFALWTLITCLWFPLLKPSSLCIEARCCCSLNDIILST